MASEHLCYVQCESCNMILMVSVPCSSLLKIVTIRCGCCASHFAVNMATFLSALQSSSAQQQSPGIGSYTFGRDSASSSNISEISYVESDEARGSYRQPEKKQRAPSFYNRFIKDEIQRIKANNPEISHKQAFSTAAKNWAHYPQYVGLVLDNRKQGKILRESFKHRILKPILTSAL